MRRFVAWAFAFAKKAWLLEVDLWVEATDVKPFSSPKSSLRMEISQIPTCDDHLQVPPANCVFGPFIVLLEYLE